MCKDKKMFTLILSIFVLVLLITGWAFADRNVMDLIVTPIIELKNASVMIEASPEIPDVTAPVIDPGMCTIDNICG